AVQPRGDAAIQLQRVGPSGEYEEDRLEGVVGIGSIPEDAPACPVHEGTMPVDEGRKRVLLACGQEAGEKARIGVALVRSRPAVEDLQGCFRHRLTLTPRTRLVPLMSICPQSADRSSKKARTPGSVSPISCRGRAPGSPRRRPRVAATPRARR